MRVRVKVLVRVRGGARRRLRLRPEACQKGQKVGGREGEFTTPETSP